MENIIQILIESNEHTNHKINFEYGWYQYPTVEQIDIIIEELMKIRAIGNENIKLLNEAGDVRWDKESYGQEYIDGKAKLEEKERKKKGFIYLIKVGEYYKIGRTKNFNHRKKSYITENPNEVEVIFFKEVKDCFKLEKELLKEYKNKVKKGEWFNLSENDVKDIQQKVFF